MTKKTLMPKAERREASLQIAVKMAKKVGAARVSMAMIAAAQKVTPALLFHIFMSREALTKAILKTAKVQGVELPEAKPTVKQRREAERKLAGKKLKVSLRIKAQPKKLAKLKAPVKPKLAAPVVKKAERVVMAVPTRKPLTPAQKTAKAQRDSARRSKPVPTTPAGKFAALPTPFEASIAAVA